MAIEFKENKDGSISGDSDNYIVIYAGAELVNLKGLYGVEELEQIIAKMKKLREK